MDKLEERMSEILERMTTSYPLHSQDCIKQSKLEEKEGAWRCNMVRELKDLSEAGREELALALILWKDFKDGGKFDPDIMLSALEFADILGVRIQMEKLMPKLPPMRIEPRHSVDQEN